MVTAYGKWKYAGINAFQHIDMDENGSYIQPEQIPVVENYSAVKKDALAYYGADSFTDYFTNYTNRAGKKLPGIIWGSYQVGFGTKPDAEYEALQKEAMETLPQMGLQDVVDWYTDRFVQLYTDLDPLIDEAVKAYGD